MALALRAGTGAPHVSAGGVPLLGSPPNVPMQAFEPQAPETWPEVFYDNFAGTSLDRAKWQILYGASSAPSGAYAWDHAGVIVNNGLTLRAWKDAAGQWRGGGIGQGNLVTGFGGYTDFQITVKARFPKGQGVGAHGTFWPVNDTWPPEFNLFETPGAAKDQVMANWHWIGNNTGVPRLYPLDLTRDHLFSARRQGNAWYYWIDGIEQPVPPEWAQHPESARLSFGLAAFVAAASETWYGGAPNLTTPNPYDAVVSYVRIHAPGVQVPTPTPAPVPVPGQVSGDVLVAQNFVSGLTSGVNVERGRAWGLGYQGAPLNASTAYWLYLKSLGITHVRFFYGYRPTVNMLGEGDTGNTIPSVERIDRIMIASEMAVTAGLKVFIDACDVMGIEDFEPYWTSVQTHVGRFADRALLRPALSPTMFCIGPVNEWAGGTNATYNAWRLALHAIIRAKMPNHVLGTGAAQWCDRRTLMAPDWAEVADRRVVAQWHHYEGGQTLALWQAAQTQLEAFSAAHGGIPTVCGEAGFNEGYTGTQGYFNETWVPNMRAQAQGIGLQRPMWWTVTNAANAWAMNPQDDPATIRPELVGALREVDTIIRSKPGWLTGDRTPPASEVTVAGYPPPEQQMVSLLTPSVAGEVVGFNLVNPASTASASQYVTFGQAFSRGAVPAGSALQAVLGSTVLPVQMDVKRLWNDGSIQFARLTLVAPAIPAASSRQVMLRIA